MRDHFAQLAAIVIHGLCKAALGDIEQHRMNADHRSGVIAQQVLMNFHPDPMPIGANEGAIERTKGKLFVYLSCDCISRDFPILRSQ